MKKINLENILKSHLTVETMLANNPDYTFNKVLSAMKDACNQALELAVENAECTSADTQGFYTVDKQSILDVINLIE